jgi:alkylated DNA repair dioxygenase AlkB
MSMPLQSSLFDAEVAQRGTSPTRSVCDGEVLYYRAFLHTGEADCAYGDLLQNVRWNQEFIQFYGKRHPIPRLTAWYGDHGARYTYSKIGNDPLPWSQTLLGLKHSIEDFTKQRFNSVLLNLYRTGADSVSWHADDEPELGPTPFIASLSLGTPRPFELRRADDQKKIERVTLEHGSLLVMFGASQQLWRHRIAKTSRPIGARINLTFRYIHPQ